ncbi:hypothetical protein H072_451 [Dactylellina haptotyla CBS 200.50]|uniref:F-box domain-containing protein n=1 Tax=Dactylellina haptotyla (strain CBS 200.50) TaxID=1284197 RepID=S8CD15_DACHA|nr:hypothetical protein H072_451 [Dactylellina haptotyla CBS 200.50]
MATPMLDLPAELFFQISSYLSFPDLKTLSLCSKSYRKAITELPMFFQRISLHPETVSAFEAGGSLHGLAHFVRSIEFCGLKRDMKITPYESNIQTIDRCRVYTSALHLFPNLTGLEIHYMSIAHFGVNIYVAIMRGIANTTAFASLRTLAILYHKYSIPSGKSLDVRMSSYLGTFVELSPSNREFLGPERIFTDQVGERIEVGATSQSIHIPRPPNLEEVRMDVWELFGKTDPWEYYQYQINFFPFEQTTKNLKRLQLFVGMMPIQYKDFEIYRPSFEPSTACIAASWECLEQFKYSFDSVEHLELWIHYGHETAFNHWQIFRIVPGWFPNIEILGLELTQPGFISHNTETFLAHHALQEWIISFKRLRRLVVPWFDVNGYTGIYLGDILCSLVDNVRKTQDHEPDRRVPWVEEIVASMPLRYADNYWPVYQTGKIESRPDGCIINWEKQRRLDPVQESLGDHGRQCGFFILNPWLRGG